ncbi:MAG: hypothetical protein ABI693_34675 [Bryobacteraceae bacterium]
MSDWIHTFQSLDSNSYDHALERWQQTHSKAWLVAALRHAASTTPGIDDLIVASAALPPADPAFETAAFYRLSLLSDGTSKAELRAELDRILALTLPKSSVNLFRGLRMRNAPTLAEFLSFAARRPLMLTYDANTEERPDEDYLEHRIAERASGKDLLDRDSIKILNEQAPQQTLREIVFSNGIPDYHRSDVLISVFTRALLLADEDTSVPLARLLRAAGADRSGYLRTYLATPKGAARHRAGTY